jgi:hypothetical protein
MTKSLLTLYILIIINLSTCLQYAYGQEQSSFDRAPSSKEKGENEFPINAGEKYLVLNKAPRIGKFRRYRFLVGQQINFKVEKDKKRFKATILAISDSSITISSKMDGSTEQSEIMLNALRLFKVSRRIPFITEAAYYFPIGGLLYIGADFLNKGIDDKRFTTDASAFIVGGSLVVAGFFCHKLTSRTIKINNRNKLRVLSSN